MAFDQFSHNSEDTIYHQKSATGLRFAFLVVSEYFDTPSHGVTMVLDEIVEHLNAKQAESEEPEFHERGQPGYEAYREAASYFVLWRPSVPNSPMVKEGNFFREQGGNKQEWGKAWEPMEAKSIGDARRKIAEKHGVKLSNIYDGEA